MGNAPNIAIWGGRYLAHVLRLPAITTRNVVQIVDRNPLLHGRTVGGCVVEHPAKLAKQIPLVIAAIVAAPSIHLDAEKLGIETILELEIADE